ncbi:ZZ-type domain-containing protein [Balamuthia mandrillaris]
MSGNAGEKQTGKKGVVIKAFYGEEIRRLALETTSWKELSLRLCSVFSLPDTTAIQIKYKDEEGDLITISTDEELSYAVTSLDQDQPLLRLFVSLKPGTTTTTAATQEQQQAPLPSSPVEQPQQQRDVVLAPNQLSPSPSASSPSSTAAQPMFYPPPFIPNYSLPPSALPPAHQTPAAAAAGQQRPLYRVPMLREAGGSGGSPMSPPMDKKSLKKRYKEEYKQQKKALKKEKESWRHQQKAYKQASHQEHKLVKENLRARFVKHVTIPDGSELAPNTRFRKTWRFRNEGNCPWPQHSLLVFISRRNGDLMGAPETVIVVPSHPSSDDQSFNNNIGGSSTSNTGEVRPGDCVDVSVDMIAPPTAGRYVGFWRMSTPFGRKFGQRVWVKIQVVDPTDNKTASTGTSTSTSTLNVNRASAEEECDEDYDDDDEEGEVFEGKPATVAHRRQKDDGLDEEEDLIQVVLKEDHIDVSEPQPQSNLLLPKKPVVATIQTTTTSTTNTKMVTNNNNTPNYALLLKQLQDLGFNKDVVRNVTLIKKYNGDLSSVIQELTS